ncbi:PEP-CTERM sorting domain-containing protein [Marinobacter sp. OP 3.4]|uniref:PEP-CTERM sorting domain-containing protein n=1 Tax=Marinobacter sp. OP 3.4 TaxID=3076501 RepID=UPI002E23E234
MAFRRPLLGFILLLSVPMPLYAGYLSLFNIEGESSLSAQYVTYNSLGDMLLDTNRQSVFTPNGFGAGFNIVGSGTDGNLYWSLFNIEGESSLSAQYVTYNSLGDMLLDTNRQGVFTPNGFGAGFNIVGSSAELLIRDIPEPASLLLLSTGVLGVWLQRRRTPRYQKG